MGFELDLRESEPLVFQKKKLPTAVAHTSIVTSNLENEISLGRVACPFDTPPFTNFQVSPIGLVPKKKKKKEFG